MSQTTQGGPERLKVSISMGETAITLFGVNTRDYYFDSGVMADVEARFHRDARGHQGLPP